MNGVAKFSNSLVAYLPLIVAIVSALGIGSIIKAVLEHKLGHRKATDDMATTIVHQLSSRIKSVEQAAERERALCEANLAVLRHRVNNLSGSFDGLLLLIEMAPEKAGEFVARIKEQRREQQHIEATEKAAVLAAQLATATPGVEPTEPNY